MKVNEVTSKFRLSHSAVNTAMKNKGKCLGEVKSAGPVQSAVMTKHGQLILEVEKLMIVWVNDHTQRLVVVWHEITVCNIALLGNGCSFIYAARFMTIVHEPISSRVRDWPVLLGFPVDAAKSPCEGMSEPYFFLNARYQNAPAEH
jgi:hypothetical protein